MLRKSVPTHHIDGTQHSILSHKPALAALHGIQGHGGLICTTDTASFVISHSRHIHTRPTSRPQDGPCAHGRPPSPFSPPFCTAPPLEGVEVPARSEEHTSELQSRGHLVC